MRIYRKILSMVKIECICGKRLKPQNLTNYMYDDGTYWIFAHCKYCEYDYNYQKIQRQYTQIRVKEMQEFNEKFI